ncbi:DUF5617 domain-containing protein [Legionella dresdenensis]|uniref:DUF5617 domain-containing protein n=1 Tax=Legionella dresdenensis TaxID=450200 RepID=A0ABV8CCP7_9GAMM
MAGEERKIIVVRLFGKKSAGKSALVDRLQNRAFNENTLPTQGIRYESICGYYHIRDISGVEDDSENQSETNSDDALILYAIDLSVPMPSADALKAELAALPNRNKAKIKLVGTKIDVGTTNIEEFNKNREAFKAAATELQLEYDFTSAKTGENVEGLLDRLNAPENIKLAGKKGAGKSALMARFLNKDHDENDEVQYASILSKQAFFQIWDMSGDEKFKAFKNINAKEALILYVIDLTAPVTDNLKEEILALPNPNDAKIKLIATKADEGAGQIEAFKALAEELKLKYYITSAKTGQGVNELLQGLNAPEIKVRARKIANNVKSLAGYPETYHELWASGSDFNSAIHLFKDYIKAPSPQTYRITSFFTRVFTGHWNRHHITTVRDMLDGCYSNKAESPKDVDGLLKALKQALIEAKEPINPEGSLARRIAYIQGKTGKNVIDVAEVNDRISQPTAGI